MGMYQGYGLWEGLGRGGGYPLPRVETRAREEGCEKERDSMKAAWCMLMNAKTKNLP
jgi:hypothetical protein